MLLDALLTAVPHDSDLQQSTLDYLGAGIHCAMWSRKAELEYLRRLTENLFPYILRPQALHSRCAPCIAQHRPFGRDASFSSVIPHTEFITPIMSKIEQSVKAF